MKKIEFKDIIKNEEIRIYINKADSNLKAMGYTEHSFTHAYKCVENLELILNSFGYSSEEIELGKIASYMHDIGNSINREDHAQLGALLSYSILNKLGYDAKDISEIIAAIGNHDESAAYPVSPISAALIIADKVDVRRSRVRSNADVKQDIHDRVNYAVTESRLEVNIEPRTITLHLTIDTEITSIMEYFEIFLSRMKLCKNAASKLNATFKIIINNSVLL